MTYLLGSLETKNKNSEKIFIVRSALNNFHTATFHQIKLRFEIPVYI